MYDFPSLALALIVAIVIVITPADAGKGGHDNKGHESGHDNQGKGLGHDPGNGTNGTNGGKEKSGDQDGGGDCNIISPCRSSRPARGPVEIEPGVFEYYGVFGQVVGTAVVTEELPDPEPEVLTSSPELETKVLEPEPAKPQPVAIVKKTVLDLNQKKAQLTQKRTTLQAEKSSDRILDILILQALERGL